MMAACLLTTPVLQFLGIQSTAGAADPKTLMIAAIMSRRTLDATLQE